MTTTYQPLRAVPTIIDRPRTTTQSLERSRRITATNTARDLVARYKAGRLDEDELLIGIADAIVDAGCKEWEYEAEEERLG